LINVDYDSGISTTKTGFAAIGLTAGDIWNLSSRDIGSGKVANLKYSDGNLSGATLLLSNAPGAWGNGASDPMYQGYLYSFSGNVAAFVDNLPAGTYDFYIYGHGDVDNQNGVYSLTVGSADHGVRTNTTSPGWQSSVWQEGIQYVRFAGVTVGAGQSVSLGVSPGAGGVALIAGMQIAQGIPFLSTCSAPPSGIISLWKAEGNAIDSIGSNDGALQNGATFSAGKVGQAFSLNGSNQYVRVPNSASLNPSGSLSLEGWIYLTQSNGNQNIITKWGDSGAYDNQRSYALEILDGRALHFPISDAAHQWDSAFHLLKTPNNAIPMNAWTHVAAVYDQNTGTRSIYINGVNITNRTDPPITVLNGTADVSIGTWLNTPTQTQEYFSGSIDELTLYGRALSAAEIQAIYNSDGGGKCAAPPVITSQPSNLTVPVGGAASFNVAATGSKPLSYLWKFNGSNISGATGASLILSNVPLSAAGNYSVLVGNSAGSTNSSNALLTVNGSSSSTIWAVNFFADKNPGLGTIKHGLAAIGHTTNDIWNGCSRDGVDMFDFLTFVAVSNLVTVDGVTTSVGLTLTNAPGAWFNGTDDAMYNTYLYPFDGNNLVVEVTNLPVGAYDFYVYGHGNVDQGGFHDLNGVYQLSVGSADYGTKSTATNGTIWQTTNWTEGEQFVVFRGVTVGGGQKVVLTGLPGVGGEALIAGMQILASGAPVAIAPVITNQPTSQTVAVGATVNFNVGASGTAPLSYQWKRNGTNISGATNISLTLSNVQLSAAGNYSVFVSNSAGSTNSSNAVLTVNPGCLAPPSGLVGWWPGEGNANDLVGGNAGIFADGPAFGAGKVGQAFSFNGVSNYVRIPAASNLNVGLGGGLTVEAWINPADVTTGHVIFEWNHIPGGPDFGAHFWAGHPSFGPGYMFANLVDTLGNWHTIDTAPGVLASNVFQHVALTYDKASGAARLFVNGVTVGATNLGTFTPQTSYDVFIGERPPPPDAWRFAGLIDEVGLYNRALSTNEVQAIYNAGAAGKCQVATPPVITSQPTNQTVPVGANATFSVVATGTPPLNYQWKLNGTNVNGETNFSLALSNVQLSAAGNYSVFVSNVAGSTNSSNALLTVTGPQPIVPSGTDLWDISQGSIVTSSSGTTGDTDRRNMFGGNFGTAEDHTRTIFSDTQPAGFVHFVEWKTPNPVTVGSFNLFAEGDGPALGNEREFSKFVLKAKSNTNSSNYDLVLYTYDVTNHPYVFIDASSKALIVTNIPPATAQQFRAEFTQFTGGRGFDGPRILELDGFGVAGAAPVITTQPTNQTVPVGAPATFSVVASGTAPLSYQWKLNGTNVSGGTNSSLTLNNVQLSQAGNYSVFVSNSIGSTNSLNALLTVNAQAPIVPSGTDLWDISQGSIVTTSSGTTGDTDQRNMFGGVFGTAEGGARTIFANGKPPVFVHFIEWQTPTPVTVGSFNLFAEGDGPAFGNEREFAKFVLKAKSSTNSTNYDLVLYTYDVTNHPYVFLDFTNKALISTNITPVTAQQFRAEFTQFNAGLGFDGPRILELDGFGTAVPTAPVITSQPTNQTMPVGANVTFNVAATGTLPLGYQWKFNGTNINGRTNSSLTLTNVQFSAAGNYSVFVSNSAGSTNSAIAVLTVITPILPSGTDLWDISQGSVVTASSPLLGTADRRNMFGGNFGSVEDGTRTLFSDAQPAGFVHFVEWQTPAPVTVGSFALFADGDGPQFNNEREFAKFVLKAKSNTNSTNYDLVLYSQDVTNHPYVFVDALSRAFLVTNIIPVTAQQFRAEFTQYTAGRGLDGPRIWELDGFAPTGGPSCLTPPSGIVSWWPGEGNAGDLIGGNPGALQNGAGFVAGEVGQAFNLNGSNQYVRIPNNASLSPSGSFSIESWVYLTASNSPSTIFSKWGGTGAYANQRSYIFGVAPGAAVSFGISDAAHQSDTAFHTFMTTNGAVPASAWTHLAAVYDQSTGTRRIFVNGVNVTNRTDAPISVLNGIADASLGAALVAPNPAETFFPGRIDEVSFYNRALTAAEVLAIYTADGGGKCRPAIPTATSLVVVDTTSSGVATVPVNLLATGNENSVGFSINYNTSLLTFTGATLGNGTPPGSSLVLNTNLLPGGKVGIGIGLPANAAFGAGIRELVKLNFVATPPGAATTTPVTFGDQPALRQVSDVLAHTITATYSNGIVTIPFLGFEGDVAPRTNGDGVISTTDWVQVGRFVAGLDTAAITPNEFQRADCAPRSTLGDGVLTVADWVQAGRYSVGLDPLTSAGGPISAGALFNPASAGNAANAAGGRTVTAVGGAAQAGQSLPMPVQLNSLGNESAVGFSVTFDPAVLTFNSADLGSGAAGATLNVNSDGGGNGVVGIALSLPIGSTFASAVQELARLNFTVAPAAAGNTTVSFANQPVVQAVADATAETLAASYVNATVTVSPVVIVTGPTLNISKPGDNLLITWPASATGFSLESTDDPASGVWTPVNATTITNGMDIIATVPASAARQFFRLHHPD
jgi:hypothetical protein